MKKVLFTILTFICCCMLVITSLFSFNSINKAGAVETSQIYNYNAEISEEYSGFGDFAIDDIQYLQVGASFSAVFTVNNTTNSEMMIFRYMANDSQNLSQYSFGFCINFLTQIEGYSFSIGFYQDAQAPTTNNSSSYLFHAVRVSSGLTTYYLRPGSTCKIIITNHLLSFTNDGYLKIGDVYESSAQRYFNEEFSYLFDMSADTSFTLNVEFSNDFGAFRQIRNYIYYTSYNGDVNSWFIIPYSQNDYYSTYDNGSTIHILFARSNIFSNSYTNVNWSTQQYLPTLFGNNGYNGDLNFNYNFDFTDFYFYIKKPAYRVNNSLLIYNFDYQDIVSSIDYICYQLSKDGDFYNVTYNGSLPNSKYIEIYNDSINNITFDEYIFLYLEFNKSFTYTYVGDYSQAYDDIFNEGDSFSVPLDFGFDFNFNYYTQPLVTNKGSYNSYRFNKPGYVDMPFSLSPFYIPVLEICENAMIFLVFYCPLISDILELIYFDRFFGALLQLFDFIFGSAIGSFILGCLAFTIFWALLKGLFPAFVSSGVAAYNDTQFAYNRRRKREDRQKEKQYKREQNYLNKQRKKLEKKK